MNVEKAIEQRRTIKVLAAEDFPCRDIQQTVQELIQVAGWAPFHRACEEMHRQNGLTGIEPWRFYCLAASACRRLKPLIPKENAGKIPMMLASADALVLVTWLPNSGDAPSIDGERGFVANHQNMEHIAAASAAIQNLLVAATARGIANYWSSGGVLRLPVVFGQLGIPTTEILLGAIFLFPDESTWKSAATQPEVVTSKLRESRQSPAAWSRWIALP